jgi:hypothetical protein
MITSQNGGDFKKEKQLFKIYLKPENLILLSDGYKYSHPILW